MHFGLICSATPLGLQSGMVFKNESTDSRKEFILKCELNTTVSATRLYIKNNISSYYMNNTMREFDCSHIENLFPDAFEQDTPAGSHENI